METQVATNDQGKITWQAYCPSCSEWLYEAPNGNFVEAAARKHCLDTEHEVIVGYLITRK